MTDVLLLSSGRAANSEPVLADGAANPLLLDLKGRLLVAQKPAVFPLQSAGLVNVNDVLNINVDDSATLLLHVKNYGTVTLNAGTFQFEASLDSTTGTDGTWFQVQATRTSTNVIENSAAISGIAAAAGNTYGWRLSVAGYKWFRVRCSTAVTASSIAYWQALESPDGIDPVPGIQTHPVSQSAGPWSVSQSGTFSVTPSAPTPHALISAASINASVVKAVPGQVYEFTIFNSTAAVIYLKFYNKATTPAPATDSALLVGVFAVPVNGEVSREFGPIGKRFNAGISYAIVGLPANTDATAVAAGAVLSLSYA